MRGRQCSGGTVPKLSQIATRIFAAGVGIRALHDLRLTRFFGGGNLLTYSFLQGQQPVLHFLQGGSVQILQFGLCQLLQFLLHLAELFAAIDVHFFHY
jgi:hypothetical protein